VSLKDRHKAVVNVLGERNNPAMNYGAPLYYIGIVAVTIGEVGVLKGTDDSGLSIVFESI
jgi:hypothetical protein